MKDSEENEIRKTRESWIIDPIQSFIDGGEGEQKQVLITAGRNPESIHDPIFWKAGKRAFEILNSSYSGNITAGEIKEFFYSAPEDLIALWNDSRSLLEPLIHEEVLQITRDGSEEPIEEFITLSPNPKGFTDHQTFEPYIRILDSIFENSNILNSDARWPYDRELVAAFFTICNIDLTAAALIWRCADEQTYELVTHWFDRIDRYEQEREAIEYQQEFLKRKKSQSMNVKRHAKSNSARELVIDNWSKGPSEFPSAAKAGLFYTEWLEGMNHEYEPTTITNWIRKHAKDTGIKLK